MKLPLDLRLSMEEIESQYKNSPASKLGNFLVIDLQNDCSCDYEKFEAGDYGESVLFLENGKWKIEKFYDQFRLYMNPVYTIHEGIINNFWTEVSQNAWRELKKEHKCECQYYKMRIGETVLNLPSKEWLGCICVNVGKIGVFIFMDRLFKE